MTHIKIIGTPLYQWESGRRVRIIPVLNTTVTAVHFSNYGDTEALSVEPKEENGMIVANIPDIYLQSGANLVVYTVNTSDDGCVETLRDCVFHVRKRAKPSDYIYTEPEKMKWESLDERIKVLEQGGGGTVKSVNGVSPDEAGNVEIEFPSGGQSENFITGAGEPFFTHTATFTTDAAAKRGVIVDGASISSLLDTVYWLEVNGELYKCHWERDFIMVYLYDEDGNQWVANTVTGIYVNAQTAGTYTFKLYAPSEKLMLAPQYLPPNIATKGDIPGKASPVADAAGETVTAAEFNALLTALRNAGYLKT